MFNMVYFIGPTDEALGEDRIRKRKEKPEKKKTEVKVKPIAGANENVKINVRDPNRPPDDKKTVFHGRKKVTEEPDYEDDPTLGWVVDYKA